MLLSACGRVFIGRTQIYNRNWYLVAMPATFFFDRFVRFIIWLQLIVLWCWLCSSVDRIHTKCESRRSCIPLFSRQAKNIIYLSHTWTVSSLYRPPAIEIIASLYSITYRKNYIIFLHVKILSKTAVIYIYTRMWTNDMSFFFLRKITAWIILYIVTIGKKRHFEEFSLCSSNIQRNIRSILRRLIVTPI